MAGDQSINRRLELFRLGGASFQLIRFYDRLPTLKISEVRHFSIMSENTLEYSMDAEAGENGEIL
jgi:late competence protein required for DNA uptake (superfamily II DNA/RNA helicase)